MTISTLALLALAYAIAEVALSLIKRSRNADAATDGGSLRMLWITIGGSMLLGGVIASLMPHTQLPLNSGALQVVGIGLFVLGVILRWSAILWLGRFFTVNVAVAADQHVIDTGPYRFIRHPSYAGALAVFLGLVLCTGNWLAMLVVLIPIGWAFAQRIRIEEAALSAGLGDSYRDYSRRTKRLIPLVY